MKILMDIIIQIILLSKKNETNFILDKNINKLYLIIQTNMILAPEIKVELNEEGKSESSIMNETNNYIIKQEKTIEIDIAELIK